MISKYRHCSQSIALSLALALLAGCADRFAKDADPPIQDLVALLENSTFEDPTAPDAPPLAVPADLLEESAPEGPQPEAQIATAPCTARTTLPAIIETVTEQIIEQPAVLDSDGQVITPAVIRIETRQNILRDRSEVEFETPCAELMTPQFVASVQRALSARGYYDGDITGAIGVATARAIERFQTDQGDVATDVLTLRSAQSLGLVAVPSDSL